MSWLDLLLGVAATAGLAYVGKKQNDEAQERNRACKQIVDECNKSVAQAKECVEQKCLFVDKVIKAYGEQKIQILNEIYKPFLRILKYNFKNFKVLNNYNIKSCEQYELPSVSAISNGITGINNALTTSQIKANQSLENKFDMKVGTFGIGAATCALMSAGTSITSVLTASTFLSFLPISLGVGYSVSGWINNFKSKQNLSNVKDYYDKTSIFLKEAKKISNHFDYVIENLKKSFKIIDEITIKFIDKVQTIQNKVSDPESCFYSNSRNKLDLATLDDKDLILLRYTVILGRILYSIYEIPLFDKDGEYSQYFDYNLLKLNRLEKVETHNLSRELKNE